MKFLPTLFVLFSTSPIPIGIALQSSIRVRNSVSRSLESAERPSTRSREGSRGEVGVRARKLRSFVDSRSSTLISQLLPTASPVELFNEAKKGENGIVSGPEGCIRVFAP